MSFKKLVIWAESIGMLYSLVAMAQFTDESLPVP